LTDATFLDFSMTFTTPLKTPSLVMRDNDTGVEFVVDVARCVEGDAGDFLNSTLQVQRSGSTVRAGIETDQGTTLSACPGVMPAAQERVAIGFRAPNAGSGTLSDVTIERAP
jgi:hypothetical protein